MALIKMFASFLCTLLAQNVEIHGFCIVSVQRQRCKLLAVLSFFYNLNRDDILDHGT